MNNQTVSRKVEKFVDEQQEISLRELLTKIYLRPTLFWSCILIPMLMGLLFAFLIPTDWKASVKIMLRYSSSESAFLRDLIPENRPTLSGASSAEILKGIPTLVNTIREQNIQDEDIYKKPHEVLGGYVSGMLEDYFPSSMPPGLPGIDPKTLLLAKAFKDSLEKSSSGSSKKTSVEVLEKSSQMPSSMKGDELITVEVRSYNREKVAQMANGLASAFIDQYYRVSTDDAHRSYVFLSNLVEKAERDVVNAERSKELSDSAGLASMTGNNSSSTQSPLLDSLSRQLTAVEGSLAQAEGVYANDSEQVQRLREQVGEVRRAVTRQERIDAAKQVLEQLKLRRYQALNTENLYKNRLVPISVVEPAFTPKKSFSKVAMRYIIGGGVGMVLGLMLGLGLIIILDATDPRLHTSWQVQKRLGLPILATLPDLGRKKGRSILDAATDSSLGMVNGLLQILGRMNGQNGSRASGGRVILLTSPSRGEGKTLLTLALAGALGQGGKHKVLLIDANVQDAGLSELLKLSDKPGYVDAMIDGQGLESRIVKNAHRGCDVVPAGSIAQITSLGVYNEELDSNLQRMKAVYDFVIIDTAPILSSNEALICGLTADSTLLLVSAGLTRRALVRAAVQRMKDVGIEPEGVVFNRKREFLPAFIYRNV